MIKLQEVAKAILVWAFATKNEIKQFYRRTDRQTVDRLAINALFITSAVMHPLVTAGGASIGYKTGLGSGAHRTSREWRNIWAACMVLSLSLRYNELLAPPKLFTIAISGGFGLAIGHQLKMWGSEDHHPESNSDRPRAD